MTKVLIPSRSQTRINWIDYAKGLGIVLVVMGHALRGELAAAQGNDLFLAQQIDAWIYAFHMPLFFFLSGLFARSLRTKTPQEFLNNRWAILIHPYLLWSLIIHGIRSIAGLSDQAWPAFIGNFWKVAHTPIGIFWFLYVLCLISSFYYFFFPNSWASDSKFPWFLIAGAIVSYGAYTAFGDAIAWEPLRLTLAFFPYFCLGSLCQERPRILSGLMASRSRRWQIALLGLGLVMIGTLSNLWRPEFGAPNLLLASFGILATIAIAQEVATWNFIGSKPQQLLRLLGQQSLQIYVLHTLVSSLTVKLLSKVLPSYFWLDVAIGTIAGLVISTAIAQLCQRMNWNSLFSLRTRAHYG
jgi:fucose 4-O-acetylase-like acetyltransferase